MGKNKKNLKLEKKVKKKSFGFGKKNFVSDTEPTWSISKIMPVSRALNYVISNRTDANKQLLCNTSKVIYPKYSKH